MKHQIMSNTLGTLMVCALAFLATACSTTSSVPEGDQLYVGLK